MRTLWPDPATLTDLSPHQQEQLARATAGPLGLFTGSPGTGKTYSVASLIRALADRHGLESIAVAAPTGKAATRCTAAIQRHGIDLTASTIHRLLGVANASGDAFRFKHDEDDPLPYRFVVVDESSMLDTDLAASLFSACAPGTRLLLVGDPYQLPPVGHGVPLRDLLHAGLPQGELTEIQRNAGMIVHACSAIKAGRRFEVAERYEPDQGRNLRHIEASKPDTIIDTLQRLLQRLQATGTFDVFDDTQIIVPINVKSELARQKLNQLLQTELNATGRQAKPNPFWVGDKVVCLRNGPLPLVATSGSAFVMNGEVGRVTEVEPRLVV